MSSNPACRANLKMANLNGRMRVCEGRYRLTTFLYKIAKKVNFCYALVEELKESLCKLL